MRHIRLIALGIVSFFAVLMGDLLAPGTFVNRALSAALCTVFSFNSTICTVNLAKSSERVVAATPPAVERNIEDRLGQRNREFDDEPNTPPANNRQAPPFPQDPGPNQPVRPDFDNRDQNRISSQRFVITRDLQEISPGLYETILRSPEGCQITRKIRKTEKSTFYESIQYTVPNNNTCGGKSYLFRFSEDGTQINAETNLNEKFLIKVNRPGAWDINYTSPQGERWIFQTETVGNSSNRENLNIQKYQQNSFQSFEIKKQNSCVTTNQEVTTTKGFSSFGSLEASVEKISGDEHKRGQKIFIDRQMASHPYQTLISSGFSCVEAPLAKIGCDLCNMAKKIFDAEDLAENIDTTLNTVGGAVGETIKMRIKGRRIMEPNVGGVIDSASGTMIPLQQGAIESLLIAPLKDYLKKAVDYALNCKGSSACAESDRLEEECQAKNPNPPQPNPQPSERQNPIDDAAQIAALSSGMRYFNASSWGDPHLTSFDGQKYDHHAIGEFVLTRSKDKHFEVQVREAPYGSSSSIAINIAAAMRVGNDRVAIYSQDFPDNNTQDPLRVNGKTISGEKQNLSGGGFVVRTGSGSYLVQWPSGEQVTVKIFNKLVEVTPGVTEGDRGQLEGLLGNFNGNLSDDFMTRDGRVIAENKEAMNIARSVLSNFDVSRWIPIPIDPLTEAFLDSIHRQFGDSWRISQTESLFDYAAGKNTDSFTNKSFPNGFVILRMLAPQAVQLAEETCRKAEVPNERLEGCLFDVAASGDVSLANVAANILKNEVKQRVEQEIRNRVPVPIPLPF